MRFLNYHAPDQVRVLTVPPQGVRRWDNLAIVYDVQVGPKKVLRHYAFPNRWFEVNCSLDLNGCFIAEEGPIAWSFNCDICTPCFTIGTDVYTMDLWLDVSVAPNGRDYVIIDEDDFAEAIRLGWPTERECRGAREGLADLVNLVQSQGLVAFLEQVWPFDSVADYAMQPAMVTCPVAEIPWFGRGERERWFGRIESREGLGEGV